MHKDGAQHKSAFDECSFGGSEGRRKTVWDLNPQNTPDRASSELTMRQPGRNRFRGEYSARKLGVRYGGAFFVSYPGKSVPVLEGNTVQVPGGGPEIDEKAMDLGRANVVATGEICCAPGNWYVKSEAKHDGPDVLPIASGALAIGAAIPNPGSPFFAVGSGGLALFDALIKPGDSGKSMARIQQWYSIRGDGSRGAPMNDGCERFEKNNNQGPEGPAFKTPRKGGIDLQVGQQFSFWIDFITQAQLKAMDTYWGWGGHECHAEAESEFVGGEGYADDPSEIQVKLYLTGNSGN